MKILIKLNYLVFVGESLSLKIYHTKIIFFFAYKSDENLLTKKNHDIKSFVIKRYVCKSAVKDVK